MGIIVEVRPRIQVCNIYITTQKCLDIYQTVNIKLKPSSIELEYIDDTKKVLQNLNFAGYNLVPNSLYYLKVKANSITFRIQTKPLSNIAGSFGTEILQYEERKRNIPEAAPSIVPNEPCKITCKCCNQLISSGAITFQRVLPLPSATWEDGDWFCHRHSDHPSAETPVSCSKIDCLYGICFILVPTSVLDLPKPGDIGTITHCSRCQAWLGTLHKGKVKLWNCNILCDGIEPNKALEDFETVVRTAIHDSVGMLCRLLVETRVNENESQYLLLWVMDKELKLLVNFDDDCANNVESKLHSVNCCKVLYIHQPNMASLVKDWQSDVNVQSVEVAKQMFVDGLEHLMNVTKRIPPEDRTANGFFVSYLGLRELAESL